MFWENFYNICKAKDTTPNAVCKQIGLSNSVATNWKNGTIPKADVIVKIAELLNCSTDYLLGISTENVRNTNINGNNNIVGQGNNLVKIKDIENLTEMELELLKKFSLLSFNEKIDVLNYIIGKAG